MQEIQHAAERWRIWEWSSELFRLFGLLEFNTWGLRLFALGLLFVFLGLLWVLISAFRTHFIWGLATLTVAFSPMFILFRWKRARPGILLALLGVCTIVVAHTLEEYSVTKQLVARERIVDGELRLTLTGWAESDYSILAARPNAAVLQMANADVTDETLDYLLPMKGLRVLDVSGTSITDAGLEKIGKLPSLESLNIARTAVTDDGFREHLLNKSSLMNLNLEHTKVSRDTARKWREAKEGRKRPLM